MRSIQDRIFVRRKVVSSIERASEADEARETWSEKYVHAYWVRACLGASRAKNGTLFLLTVNFISSLVKSFRQANAS